MSEDRLASVTSPEAAYKWLIDEIADATRIDQTAAEIREHGHHLRRNDADFPLDDSDQQQKDLLLPLSAEHRETQTILMRMKMESNIREKAKKMGLQPTQTPPKRIKVIKQD